MSAAPRLEVRGLGVNYGPIAAVKALDLDVGAGEIVCLVGSNGAGKSSSLKGIMGLEDASGAVRLDGAAVERMSTAARVRRGIALVPEGRHVFPNMTVRDNLLAGSRGVSTDLTAQRLESNLSRFPRLRERLTQLAGTMSGGEQQMLAIGRALMSEPKALLLDEPTLGLAPVMVDAVAEVLLKLRAADIAVLLAEQNLRMALAIADRGYVLESGACTINAPASQLKDNPRVIAAYLGEDVG